MMSGRIWRAMSSPPVSRYGNQHRKARLPEVVAQKVHNIGLIINDKDGILHAPPAIPEPGHLGKLRLLRRPFVPDPKCRRRKKIRATCGNDQKTKKTDPRWPELLP
jgi:hypothetical protein